MIKKNLKQIIIIAILLGLVISAQIAPYGSSRLFDALKIGKRGTIRELKEFSLADTASVTRIFMVDKDDHIMDLKRQKNNEWIANNKFVARKPSVDLLLETLHKMTIKAPVANSAVKNIIKNMATKSVKVEVYSGDDIVKTYYIGGVTQSMTGTYAMIEGSTRPFIVEIRGFRGYLSGRFFLDENSWRSPKVLHFPQNNLKKVEVMVGNKPKQSFSVDVKGHNNFQLYDFKNNPIKDFVNLNVKSFIDEFASKYFDNLVLDEPREKFDSLLKANPFYEFNIFTKNNDKLNLKLYHLQSAYNKDDVKSIELINGIINDSIWVIFQTNSILPLFRMKNDFLKK